MGTYVDIDFDECISDILNSYFNVYKVNTKSRIITQNNSRLEMQPKGSLIIDYKKTEIIYLIEYYFHSIRPNRNDFPRQCHGISSHTLSRCQIRENSTHFQS